MKPNAENAGCLTHLSRRSLTLLLIGIYTWSLFILLAAHYIRTAKDPGLIGEELAVAFRDTVCFENRRQHDLYAPYYSASIFYWAGNHLLPLTIHTGRLLKIFTVATLPVLLMLLVRYIQPNISLVSSLFGVGLFTLIAPVSWYSIMSTENVLDCPFGLLVLYLALTTNWRASPPRLILRVTTLLVLTAFSVHIYGSSLILLLTAAVGCFFSHQESGGGTTPSVSRSFVVAGVFASLGALLSLWPLIVYESSSVSLLTSTASFETDWASLEHNFVATFRDFFHYSGSYMIINYLPFAAFPWRLGGLGVMVLAVVGLTTVRSNRNVWLLITLIGLSIIVATFAGINPGIRRVVPLVAALTLAAGLGFERLRLAGSNNRSLKISNVILAGVVLWSVFNLREEYIYANALILFFVLVLSIWFFLARHTSRYVNLVEMSGATLLGLFLAHFIFSYAMIAERYQAWLQRDFTFLPNKNYEQTVETLVTQAQEEELQLSLENYSCDTILLVELLCRHRNLPCIRPVVLADPEEIAFRCPCSIR